MSLCDVDQRSAARTAWLTNDSDDASRWLSRSITKENSTRPTTAIAVSTRDRDRGALAPDHRIQKRDQVNDEADLREQHQRKRR